LRPRNHYGPAGGWSKGLPLNIASTGASIIDLRAYVDPSVVPTLVLLDLQQEYVATTRALAVPDPADALVNCRAALAHARAKGFPVAFVRWLARSAFFNPATRFSRWIDGFEPWGSDMVFERDQPSCYASTSFDQVMTECGGNFVLAGFAGEAACLATTVDAFNRGHRITYLADASASHALDEVAAGDVHRIVSKVIGVYGEVMLTRNWIAATSRKRKWREQSDGNEQDRTA
jgi:nicotinamidase-related amidase